ncbi:MAG: gliding motility-associated protein GldE [Dysgonamonadaceae bacterium]|nr:gliding motility-associated protein GldE [Dysgonamonadaceae bacterium]MDD3309731.1 gliding motility-associated protein GldE [Dysgonamonadaceae bacterium]MDD3899822.1 gliding motility-associated protein GldE [Dysgonamonadaceae bacterium]MDD4398608.1 gliding motility-associated protein GldE [Dysgonamonadaceae bacterium]
MTGYIFPINDPVTNLLLLALLVLLIIINVIISGSERALFSIEQKDLDACRASDKINKTRITHLLDDSQMLSASINTAYNILNISIITLCTYLLNKLPSFAEKSNDFVLELIISFLIIIIFIEIIPKLYTSQNPLRFANRHIRFINGIYQITGIFIKPFIKTSVNKANSSLQRKHEISMEDLSKALEITSAESPQDQEKDMLEGIIRFRDKIVDDILIPRTNMIVLNNKNTFKEVIKFIVEAGFSRIPVFDDSPDNIKGILYVKDLLPYLRKPDTFKWQTLIRNAYFVPGTKRIDDLLEEFRTNKNHMAIVVDEYGGTAGLVTMEDILEEIVGDISDEYDEDVTTYTLMPDGSYIFEAKTTLEDFIKITNVPEEDFEEISENADTLAGLILEIKGDFPKRKESIVYNQKYTFQTEELNKRRILKVRYIPPTING